MWTELCRRYARRETWRDFLHRAWDKTLSSDDALHLSFCYISQNKCVAPDWEPSFCVPLQNQLCLFFIMSYLKIEKLCGNMGRMCHCGWQITVFYRCGGQECDMTPISNTNRWTWSPLQSNISYFMFPGDRTWAHLSVGGSPLVFLDCSPTFPVFCLKMTVHLQELMHSRCCLSPVVSVVHGLKTKNTHKCS